MICTVTLFQALNRTLPLNLSFSCTFTSHLSFSLSFHLLNKILSQCFASAFIHPAGLYISNWASCYFCSLFFSSHSPTFFCAFNSNHSFLFSLQVMQVVNADALVVKLNSGEYKTIHLSSIRPPRIEGEVETNLCICLFVCLCAAVHV